MALKEYKKKRSFIKTPEPQGGKPSGTALQFVIQKHAASHLHYDFRLELDGVLKSWAIPKGPSLNPADKRLAMQVEDHPFDYKDFEGIIPAGNYGAGTVIVWDEGVYEPLAKTDGTKEGMEKALRKELKSGSLKFSLHGKKLKGEFALVHTHGRGENSWLLIKHRDRYASEEVITEKDKSVLTKKTLEQIAANPKSALWISGRKAAGAQLGEKTLETMKGAGKKSQVKPVVKPERKSLAQTEKTVPATSGRKAAMPKNLSPMLATLVDKPFDEDGWQYEIKWDGYRALAYLRNGAVELRSRNNKSFDEKFYAVYDALKTWKINALVDGEIVVINEQGQSNFGNLQNWRSEADGNLIYYVFDLLWHEGRDLTQLPLSERRELLKTLVPHDNGIIRISENFDTGGTEFFEAAQKMGLEGILAKKSDSLYTPGSRSREWLKIKTASRQEVVIGGYTRNDGSSKAFSSLLVGVFEKGKLQYTGKIGTGFNDAQQKEMLKKFKPLIQKKPPFEALPDINKPSRFRPDPPHAEAVWLKPVLLCEVSFREMTEDGVMRHPSFEGMREDKKAKEVGLEKALPVKEAMKKTTAIAKPPATGKKSTAGKVAAAKQPTPANKAIPEKKTTPAKQSILDKMLTPAGAKERKTFLNPTDETQVREINGHDMTFSHLSKIFWPKEKITKRELLNYYYQVAPYILPYLRDRPQSLNRHPNGILGQAFYQKDVKGKAPDWMKTFPYHSEADSRDKEFLVCTDEASLLYMISLGCIEVNPWSSRVESPDNPDWCIIDLDPDTKTPYDKVIEAALITKQILDTAGVKSYCKTSGSTGMHIYFPLGAQYTYEHSKEFARLIVQLVHAEIPSYTSIERATTKRKGKMYLDFLQNRPQATLAAPYSVRPKPGATVSTPLHWEEVKKGLKISDFSIKNILPRIKAEGDLFKPVLGKGINMEKALKKLQGLQKEAETPD